MVNEASEIFADVISDGSLVQIITTLAPSSPTRKSFRYVETLSFVYSGALIAGIVDLWYEYRAGQPSARVPLWRANTDENTFLPLINGFGVEAINKRALGGRNPVIINPSHNLIILVAGFPSGRILNIRGRYWESDTAAEILQYAVGLNV